MSTAEPLHPLAEIARLGRGGAHGHVPLRITIPRREIVQIAIRRGQMEAAALAMRSAFGLDFPPPGRAASGPDMIASWVQPGTWLLTAPWSAEGALAERLARILSGHAAIMDQSHGRVTIAIEGHNARAVLAKGCRLDLHPRAFASGHVASTAIAQVGCLIHQSDASPRFELTIFTSYARPLFHWLTESAAEFGYEIA